MTLTAHDTMDTLSTEMSHHDHVCRTHDDVCDDECCIAAARIPGEGWE